MYEIIATKDFIELMKSIPLEYVRVLTNSFVSIKKIPNGTSKNTFIYDLIEELNREN